MSVNKSENQRVHTVTWEDPTISARDAASISGMDFLLSIKEGRINPPPIARLVGYRLSEVDHGRTVFELEPAEYHYNPFAAVHGGVASILLDSAMTSAVLSTLPVGLVCTTIEMKINLVRPMNSRTGLVRGEGKVIHVGSRIATAEGRVTDLQGKLYAHAVSTCMIIEIQPET